MTASEGRTDRRPLLPTFAGRPDNGMPQSDTSPTLDARMKDGPRRNQGGVLAVEHADVAATLKAQRGKAGGGIGPEETLVPSQVPSHEVAPTMVANSGSHGYRPLDNEEPTLIAEVAARSRRATATTATRPLAATVPTISSCGRRRRSFV